VIKVQFLGTKHDNKESKKTSYRN